MIPQRGHLALVCLWLVAAPCAAQRLSPVEYAKLRREALTLHQASNHAGALPPPASPDRGLR